MNEIEQRLHVALTAELQGVVIVPQLEVGPYRVDFGVFSDGNPPVVVGVEVDGYEFHERRIGAAIADRQRDREILWGGGIPILRFMGSEVHHNAADCAVEVGLAILRLHVGARREGNRVAALDPVRMLRDSKDGSLASGAAVIFEWDWQTPDVVTVDGEPVPAAQLDRWLRGQNDQYETRKVASSGR